MESATPFSCVETDAVDCNSCVMTLDVERMRLGGRREDDSLALVILTEVFRERKPGSKEREYGT